MKRLNLSLAFNLSPEKAIEYFKSKNIEVNFDWEKASADAKAKAFAIAGQYKQDILITAKELIEKALANGTTFQDFKKEFNSKLAQKGFSAEAEGLTVSRLENIFRTNTQTAYMAGHYKDLIDSKEYLPYWEYYSIMDNRTTVLCSKLNKVILPATHKFWDTYFPPNHFKCRATVLPRSKDEVTPDMITSEDQVKAYMDSYPVTDGFNYNPGKSSTWDTLGPTEGILDVKSINKKGIITLSSDNKKYFDFGRPKIKELPDSYFLEQPEMLAEGINELAALEVMEKALFLSQEKKITVIQTPIEKVAITSDLLKHIVEKRDNARERYANYIIPTLQNPFEIYLTKYSNNEYRKQYIGLFKGKNNLLTIVRINADGSIVLWNAMNTKGNEIDKHRIGMELLFKK